MGNALLKTALWGDLFRDRDVEAHFSAKAMLRHFVAFEIAWIDGLIAQGKADQQAGERARAALERFKPDLAALGEAVSRDGLPVPDLVRQVRNALDANAAEAFHSGATSQDVLDTSLVLASRDLLHVFGRRLDGLVQDLGALADRHGDAVVMGRTRMQAALPISVRDRIDDWTVPLSDLKANLSDLIDGIGLLQAGGPVGLGAHDDAFRNHVAHALALRTAGVWHSDRRVFLDLGHWLTKVTGGLGKLGQDVVLMAQQGIDEVRLEGGGGSSAMPHKQNPVRAELLVAFARVVAGNQGILAQGLVHEQERSGTSMAVEWMTLPAMFETTGTALTMARDLVGQVRSIGVDSR